LAYVTCGTILPCSATKGSNCTYLLRGILVTTHLLYKNNQHGHGENLRGGHHETYSVYLALLGISKHHDGLLCRALSCIPGVCVSGVWWLRGRGCVDWHRAGLGRIPPSSSPRPFPRLSLWRALGTWAVASVSECRCSKVVKILDSISGTLHTLASLVRNTSLGGG
jgi:hypothetical protein